MVIKRAVDNASLVVGWIMHGQHILAKIDCTVYTKTKVIEVHKGLGAVQLFNDGRIPGPYDSNTPTNHLKHCMKAALK